MVIVDVLLSEETEKRLQALFQGEDLKLATDLLVSDCADNLPFRQGDTPSDLERIRYSVMKLSNGDLSKLYEAIQLSQKDWRDTLVLAGFGDDPRSHLEWWPDVKDSD